MVIKRIKREIMILLFMAALLPMGVGAEELPFQSGDQVVIWQEKYSAALSAESGIVCQAGAEVSWGERLTGYTDSEIWTVTALEDGSWIFENAGRRLSLDEKSKQLTLDGGYDRWSVTDLGDGYVRLTNPDTQRHVTWYPAVEAFVADTVETEQNRLRIYVLPKDTGEATEATTQETTGVTSEETSEETTGASTEEASEETTTETTEIPEETTTETTVQPPATEPSTGEENSSTDAPEWNAGNWNLYFGQLHAHTADSDGAGTVEEAFQHAAGVAGLDFFAVTDHSDSFDNDINGALEADGSEISRVWAAGKAAAEAVTDEAFVGIYGFEMSWNQGQGHVSTFNTPGWLSRDRDGYQKYKDGMENYFDALLTVPESISQFNHPGTFYGDFKNFSGYSPQTDALITLIEVGNGAGSEYQTAYEYYTRALDKGWHLAPTNNQNNHEGSFGDADSGRTVVLAEELTEQSLFDAMRNYRVYATEDSDLHVYVTLDGAVMGSELPVDRVGERAELVISLYDPTDEALGTVEVIGPGGEAAASAPASEKVSFSLPSDEAYYYIRIIQSDGDIAVTAPVWIRQREDLGISRLETQMPVTRAGEAQTIHLEVYNNEAQPLILTSVTLSDDAGLMLSWKGETTVEPFGRAPFSFGCSFDTDGVRLLTATVRGSFEEEERVFSRTLEVEVLPVAVTSDILIDGTHGGAAAYSELLTMAAEQQISLRVETDTITSEQLAACSLLIIPAPAETFEEEFLEVVCGYVNQGGGILLLGTAGGSEELNRMLDALGSQMKLNTDTARDEVSNGGAADQLYTVVIHASEWTEGILEGQTFAHISGCTLTAENWLVKSAAGEVLLAVEGNVMLAGSDFLGDTWLKASENQWAIPYANRTVARNLLGITRIQPEIAPIGQVRSGAPGSIYLVEGLVTAGTHNVNNDFPDTIYVQDDTGAIRAVGYSEHGLELGRRVRILGSLETVDGYPRLRILHTEFFEKNDPVEPEPVGNDLRYAVKGDQLLKLEGTVVSVEMAEGAVKSFILTDDAGASARVWVEDYIFSGSLGWNHLESIVKVGNRVSAVGLCHLQEGEAVLRIRDCDEVVLLWAPPEPTEPPQTEAPTEAPTKPPSYVTTEATTAPPTEAETEPSTESPATTEPPITTVPTVPETEAPPDTGTNPPTGDMAFPYWAVLSLAVSGSLLAVLCKRRRGTA